MLDYRARHYGTGYGRGITADVRPAAEKIIRKDWSSMLKTQVFGTACCAINISFWHTTNPVWTGCAKNIGFRHTTDPIWATCSPLQPEYKTRKRILGA